MATNYRTRDDASPNNNTCTDAPGEKKAHAAAPERPEPFGMTDGYLAHDEIGRRQKGENLNYHDVVKGAGKLSMPKPEPKEGYKVHTVAVKHGSSADGHIKDAGGDAFGYLGHFRQADNVKKGHNVGAPGDPRDMANAASGAASGAMGAAGDVANTLTGGLFGGGKTQVMRPGIEARPTKQQLTNPTFAGSHPVAEAQAKLRQARKGLGGAGSETPEALKSEVSALKGERKAAFGDIKAARKNLRTAKKESNVTGPGGGHGADSNVAAAKAALKATKSSAKTRFKGAYQAKFGPKQYA